MQKINADFCRSADTHLLPVRLPAFPAIHLYLKDESIARHRQLKHRLARSLFLYALTNGRLKRGRRRSGGVVGQHGDLRGLFRAAARLAVHRDDSGNHSKDKIALIEAQGGPCHLVDDPTTIYSVAARLATDAGGHFMDQFTYAERATDWRGNNNIAETIFAQLKGEPHPAPDVDRRPAPEPAAPPRLWTIHPVSGAPHASMCRGSGTLGDVRLISAPATPP